MNKMAKQMEMFNDGGLMDEGGTVDPVSGNDVPPGSTQEEVRDDIPAQLSEGEFVFPADVVRYFGLEKLMEMRQEAKMGLQRMDDMGQMGNSEEAIMPDNLPFDIDDIDMEDDNELEMSQGGVVHMANGGPVGQIGTFNPSNPLPGALGAPVGQIGPNIQAGTQVVVYGPDGTAYGNAAIAQAAGVTNYTMTPPAGQTSQPTPQTGQATAPVQAASAQFQPAGTKFTPTTTQKVMPTFKETIGMGVPYVDYDPTSEEETEETEEIDSPLVETAMTTQQSPDGGGDNQTYGGGTSLLTGEKIAGYSPEEIKSGVASAKDRYAVTGNRGIDLLNFLPGGQLLKGLLGTDDKPSTGLFSNTPEAMPTGFTDSDGNMIPSASADYMKNLGGLPSTDTMTETIRTSGSPLPNMNVLPASGPTVRNIQKLRGMLGVTPTRYVGFEKGDLDPNSGGFFDKNGIAVDPRTGDQSKNESGTFNYSSFADFKKAFSAGSESGWRGGKVGASTYSGLSPTAKANYDKFANIMGYTDHSETAANQAKAEARAEAVAAAKESAQQTAAAKAAQDKRADEKAEAEAQGFTGYGDYSSEDSGSDSDGPAGNDGSDGEAGGGAQGGGYGGGTDCLTEDMKVKLNGVVDFVTNIKVGDMIDNYRVKEVLHKHMRSGYYTINNELRISNDHPVLANGTWTCPEDLVIGDNINGIPVSSLEYVERMTPTVSIVIDGESFDVHTENNIYTVHGRYREVRQEAA